ncbi:MAG: helix-turn-helix transcriptional regulator [Paracoccaceae bacterium]|nr:helix-turn-helix transcriptional regulator [Paracoccaceae bacterium]
MRDDKAISGDGTSIPDLTVLDGIASWCGGLHGSMPLSEALQALASGLGASAAAISRHHYRSEELARTVALYSGQMRRPLRRSFGQDVLGYLYGTERLGSVIFMGDLLGDPQWSVSPALRSWMSSKVIHEIAVIPLARTRNHVDFIEFHFDHVLDRTAYNDLERLVPTIMRSWNGRKPGLVTHSLIDERIAIAHAPAADRKPAQDEPLLGVSNPARLSRAEFRVCLMLSRGLSVKGVAEALSLSENTVRSHLRAIYSKTDTSNLAELMYCILSVGRPEDETEYRFGTR